MIKLFLCFLILAVSIVGSLVMRKIDPGNIVYPVYVGIVCLVFTIFLAASAV